MGSVGVEGIRQLIEVWISRKFHRIIKLSSLREYVDKLRVLKKLVDNLQRSLKKEKLANYNLIHK